MPWSCPASRPTSRGSKIAWPRKRSRRRCLFMQSNGGVAGGATIRRAPALTALSGPAAGVVGARDVAAACGIPDIITVDIGGTSADICLIKDGKIDAHAARPCRRMAAAAANGRHGDDRRRRRLDRPRIGRRPHGRTAECRRGSRPRGLRTWRRRGDGHRRPCRAGPSAGKSAGRPDGARRCGRAPGDRAAGRDAAGGTLRPKRPRAAFWPSSTTTWWARCASSRSSAATIRAISPSCRSAAPARCMAARWPSFWGSPEC